MRREEESVVKEGENREDEGKKKVTVYTSCICKFLQSTHVLYTF